MKALLWFHLWCFDHYYFLHWLGLFVIKHSLQGEMFEKHFRFLNIATIYIKSLISYIIWTRRGSELHWTIYLAELILVGYFKLRRFLQQLRGIYKLRRIIMNIISHYICYLNISCFRLIYHLLSVHSILSPLTIKNTF